MADSDDSSYATSSDGDAADANNDNENAFLGVRAIQPSANLDRYRLRDFETGSAFVFDVQSAAPAKICITAGARLCISGATLVEYDDESDEENSDDSDDKKSYTEVTKAKLTINTPRDDDLDDDGNQDGDDENLTVWDYRRGDARTVTSLGIAVSGPVILHLGVRCRSSALKAINVFGSVILDDQVVSYGYNGGDDEEEAEDYGHREEEELMQQLMEEERMELEEDAADPVDIVPAQEEDWSSPDNQKKASSEKKKKKEKKSGKKRKMSEEQVAERDAAGAKKAPTKDDNGADADADADDIVEKPLSKKQRKKLAKKKAQELADAVAREQGYDQRNEDQEEGKESKKEKSKKKKEPTKSLTRERRVEGGVIVRDIVVGAGPTVKAGRKVSINYEGSLEDGTVFDKNTSKSSPMSFRPGTGEVIKGLDKGMEGMKVEGERIITIPPAMGYGKKGNAVIPKNATLVFKVKLLACGRR